MEILEFIFRSFWHFLGTAILIDVTLDGVVKIIKRLKS